MARFQHYTDVPEIATVAGAPISRFTAFASANNDRLFEELLRGLTFGFLGTTLNDGRDGGVVNHSAGVGNTKDATKLWRVREFRVLTQWDVIPGIPLVVMATEEIFIDATINATGKGIAGGHGQLGGAGGGAVAGAATPIGKDIRLPFSEHVLEPGGQVGLGPIVSPVHPLAFLVAPSETMPLRYLPYAHLMAGGASGGGPNGGIGGGVVILAAPKIRFSGTGKIEANGTNGGADSGGGGGGCVILITRELIPNNIPMSGTPNPPVGHPDEKVFTLGGSGVAGAGNGSHGHRLLITLP